MGNMINMIGGITPKQYLEEQTITPGTADQVINAGTYLRGAQTIKGDPDLIAANIKEGVNIFGRTGTLQQGALFGLTKFSQGSFTLSTTQTSDFTLQHGLGEKPKLLVIYTDDDLKNLSYTTRAIIGINRCYVPSLYSSDNMHAVVVKQTASSSVREEYNDSSIAVTGANYGIDSITLTIGSTTKLYAGKTYYWAVFA